MGAGAGGVGIGVALSLVVAACSADPPAVGPAANDVRGAVGVGRHASIGMPNRRAPESEDRSGDDTSAAAPDAYGEAMVTGAAKLYSGDYEGARLAYLEAMELQPASMAPALGALRSLAIAGHAEARTDIAGRIRHKIKAYQRRPETLGAGYLLSARLSLALGETGEALDEARLAVQHMPELGVAWRILGEAAMAAELWGEAVDSFKTAVGLGLSAQAGTWERLADAHDELGELGTAEAAARKALELTGGDPHARRRRLNMLTVILKHRGDLKAATKAANEARALGAEDPTVLHNLGSLAEADDRADEALKYYADANKAYPVPTTLWRRGHLLLKLDRPNEALQAFTAAAANLERWSWPASTRWMPAYEVGKLYARAGHHAKAIGWFEDALREARTAEANREIVSWLAFAKVEQGAADEPGP